MTTLVEGSFTPGQIIIPEQTVTTKKNPFGTNSIAALIASEDATFPLPDSYLIIFDETKYNAELKSEINKHGIKYFYIGENGEDNKASFLNYPFYIDMGDSTLILPHLATPEPGEHTISVIGTSKKSTPKVFTFPKGRTIISELSRINKAFGTISKKKTIIGQLSDIADAAEAGKIGGGSGGAFMVHMTVSEVEAVMDKTWQEIHDALKTTSVYIIEENEEEMFASPAGRIVTARYSDGSYRVYTDNDAEFTTGSSDGYPMVNIPR